MRINNINTIHGKEHYNLLPIDNYIDIVGYRAALGAKKTKHDTKCSNITYNTDITKFERERKCVY